MAWLKGLLGLGAPQGDAKALVRVAQTAWRVERRRQAVAALAHVPLTQGTFDFLKKLLDDSDLAESAVFALAHNNEAGREIVRDLARSGGPLARVAANELGLDHRRPPAVLFEIAMTSDSYHEVEQAVNDLARWRTAEAQSALATFHQGVHRHLKHEYIESLDGTGTRYEGEGYWLFKSTRELGQQPTPEEREAEQRQALDERHRRVFRELLALGDDDDIRAYARRCLEAPGYSQYGFNRLGEYLKQAGSNAKAAVLKRALESGDRTRLETNLIDFPTSDGITALEVLGTDDLWPRLLEREAQTWRGPSVATSSLCARYPDRMAEVLVRVLLAEQLSSEAALAAAGILNECGAAGISRLAPVLTRLSGALRSPEWAERRDAIKVTAILHNDKAHTLLREFLAVEQDYSLQSMAANALAEGKT